MASASGPSPFPVLILYATQTGNAESISESLSVDLNTLSPVTALAALRQQRAAETESVHASLIEAHSFAAFIARDASLSSLPSYGLLLFIVSTTGAGELPDSAARFSRALRAWTPPSTDADANTAADGTPYAILALGDTGYDNFCGGGEKISSLLKKKSPALSPLWPMTRADDALGLQMEVEPWKDKVIAFIRDKAEQALESAAAPVSDSVPVSVSVSSHVSSAALSVPAVLNVLSHSTSLEALGGSTSSSAHTPVALQHTLRLDPMLTAENPPLKERELQEDEHAVDELLLPASMPLVPAQSSPLASSALSSASPANKKTLARKLPPCYLFINILPESDSADSSAVAPPSAVRPAPFTSAVFPHLSRYHASQHAEPDFSPLCLTPVLAASYLTSSRSHQLSTDARVVVHVDLSSSALPHYSPGHALGVYPVNPHATVLALLARLRVSHPLSRVSITLTSSAQERRLSFNHLMDGLSLAELFTHCVDIEIRPHGPKPALFALLAHHTDDKAERRELRVLSLRGVEYDDLLRTQRYSLLDLLTRFPSALPPIASLLSLLQPISYRLYSINSSPHAGEGAPLSFAFTLEPHGLASSFLVHALTENGLLTRDDHVKKLVPTRADDPSDVGVSCLSSPPSLSLALFVRRSYAFSPPPLSLYDVPLLLIGPGTGVSPFRGFVQEREAVRRALNNVESGQPSAQAAWETLKSALVSESALRQRDTAEIAPAVASLSVASDTAPALSISALGAVSLYFGCRHSEHDELYARDFLRLCSSGTLTNYTVAYSRPDDGMKQAGRGQYVQHRLTEDAEAVWALLLRGGRVYVCGDGTAMARQVRATIVEIISKYGKMSIEDAASFIRDRHCYFEEIW